ncbi:MAG: DUF4382 domain-containing protein [Nevskia sp.]
MKYRILAASAAAGLLLSACGGGGAGTGSATLGVTDAAVDNATHVVVQFTGVELKPQGGNAVEFDFPAPRQIDLLALNGGGSTTLIQGVTVPSGSYEYVRLKVIAGRTASDSYIDLTDGTRHALFIPSGNETGLKLVGGFAVPDGGFANFVIDFDLRKSVNDPPGQDGVYILKPVLRIVNSDAVGSIAGTVSNARATATGCTPAVYVYAGSNFVPGDEGSANAPLTTAAVKLNSTTGAYEYKAAFLPAGAYTVAYTCNAALDDPSKGGDAVTFQTPTNASVTVGAVTAVSFP